MVYGDALMGINAEEPSPRLKIERAKHHIKELDTKLRAFLDTDFYALSVQADPGTGDNSLKFQITKSFPIETTLITGDAVHNLRSALDLAWAKLIRKRLPAIFDKFTKFPIRDSRNELIAALKGRKIHKSYPSLFDLVLSIKPYKGGNDALFALHELDILDKHRLLLPVVGVVALHGVDAEDDRNNRFTNMTLITTSAFGTLVPLKTASNLHIKKYGEPSFQVYFDKGLPMERKPLIPTLEQFVELASNVVDLLDALR